MRLGLLCNSCSAALVASLALSGCASFPILKVGTTKGLDQSQAELKPALAEEAGEADRLKPGSDRITIPARTVVAPIKPAGESELKPEDIDRLLGPGTVSVSLPPQPIPQFLDTAFGEILKVPYALGANIGNRQEVVTLRSSPDMPRAQFFALLQGILRDYGLRLFIRNGSVFVQGETGPTSEPAVMLRGRSAKDMPEGPQPVIQFFQLQTLESNIVQSLVQDLFPASRTITVTSEPSTNTLVLKGSADDVQGVVGFLETLDQPAYAGSTALRFRPIFWGADAFAKALEDTLSAEGYKISRSYISPRAIMILTMPNTGQVLVFVNDEALLKRVQFWADALDQPSGLSDQKSTFVYEVQNTSAKDLAAMATGSGVGANSVSQLPTGVAGSAPVSSQTAQAGNRGSGGGTVASGGSIGVDTVGNRILFTGSAAQYASLRNLLEQLDKPAPQVMIEVTVAEVTLTDQTQLGLEWFFNQKAMGGTFSGGTEAKLGLGGSGLLAKYARTDLRAAFNAFAKTNKVNILSRPRLTAKSGDEARIQVGTDIPIITSQAGSNVQTTTGTQILQTVQYRQTGVILTIKPTVFGNNRVDLEISQEVSKQTAGGSAAIASPTIGNRSLTTKLSLTDGATHVMGGLMDDSFSKGNQGIPFLKDFPLLGNAFRTDTVDGSKTELVLLVTPFILHNADDMAALTNQMTNSMNRALRIGRGGSYTLTGISTGLNLGINLPPARPKASGNNHVVPLTSKAKRRAPDPNPSARP